MQTSGRVVDRLSGRVRVASRSRFPMLSGARRVLRQDNSVSKENDNHTIMLKPTEVDGRVDSVNRSVKSKNLKSTPIKSTCEQETLGTNPVRHSAEGIEQFHFDFWRFSRENGDSKSTKVKVTRTTPFKLKG